MNHSKGRERVEYDGKEVPHVEPEGRQTVEQRQYETRKVALTMLGEIKQVAMSVSRTKSFGSLEIIVTLNSGSVRLHPND